MSKKGLPGKGIISAISDGLNVSDSEDKSAYSEAIHPYIVDLIHDIARSADNLGYNRNALLYDISNLLLMRTERDAGDCFFNHLKALVHGDCIMAPAKSDELFKSMQVINVAVRITVDILDRVRTMAKDNGFDVPEFMQYAASIVYSFGIISDISKLPVESGGESANAAD